jgi:fumarylacetoacetate (FAA) hydrolase family protein
MTAISIQGTLPVPVLVNGVRIAKVTMTALSVEEIMEAHQTLEAKQYIEIGEFVAALQWGHDPESATAMKYDQLFKSSSQNLIYVRHLKAELDAKEREAAAEENTPA